MAKQKVTINEALVWMKTLKSRHAELVALRNQNAARTKDIRYLTGDSQREQVIEPLYDVIALDQQVDAIAKEIRLLESAIKSTNATTLVDKYEMDDAILGTLVPAKK